MYAHRKQPKMGMIFLVGRQLFTASGRQSQTQRSHLWSRGQALCGLEVDCPALEPGPDMEICSAGGSNSKCRWTRLCQASSHLMAAVWDTVWKHHMGYSLPHIIPQKLSYSHTLWIFHFSSQIHFQGVEYSFSFFFAFPVLGLNDFHLAKLNASLSNLGC